MARKRKSDPIPLRKSKDLTPLLRLPQSDTDTNSSVDNSNNSGEELEKLISVIHGILSIHIYSHTNLYMQ